MSSSVGEVREVVATAARACGGARRHVGRLAVLAPAEELDALGDDLDGLALRAVLSLPLTPLEAAVDRDGATLREVLRAVLALLSPDGDVEVVRFVRPLARLVLAARVHREPQRAHGRSRRRVPELGIPREVADQNDAVDVACHLYSSSSSTSDATTASSRAGAPTATGRTGLPSIRRVAMWRMTPSSIRSTRETSSSVPASHVNCRRW